MLDFLIQIPGPLFLLYFLIYSVVVIIKVRSYVRNDYTAKCEVPEPTGFDPLDLSILKDGVDGAVRFIVYKLWREQFIVFKNNRTIETVAGKSLPSDSLYLETYKKIGKSVLYKDLLKGDFRDFIEKKVSEKREMFTELKFIPDQTVLNHYKRGMIMAQILLIGIGGTKLMIGISRDKPVFFLAVLLFILSLIVYRMFSPKNKLTALGRKFVENAAQRFEYLLNTPPDSLPLNETDLSYGVAIFGVIPLLATYGSVLFEFSEMYNYRLAGDPSVDNTSTNNFSDSGCSGSGCSGGSGCGGGGGCGGCGGD